MTALIYIVCFFAASVVQVLLRSLLTSGAVPIIPGSVVIYLVALWGARKWSASYKENKEMKKIQEELATEHKDGSNKSTHSLEDKWICKCGSENVKSLSYCPICKRTREEVQGTKE